MSIKFTSPKSGGLSGWSDRCGRLRNTFSEHFHLQSSKTIFQECPHSLHSLQPDPKCAGVSCICSLGVALIQYVMYVYVCIIYTYVICYTSWFTTARLVQGQTGSRRSECWSLRVLQLLHFWTGGICWVIQQKWIDHPRLQDKSACLRRWADAMYLKSEIQKLLHCGFQLLLLSCSKIRPRRYFRPLGYPSLRTQTGHVSTSKWQLSGERGVQQV